MDVTNFFIALVDIKEHTLHFPYHVDTVDTELAPEIFNFSQTGSLTGKVIKAEKSLIFFSNDLAQIKKENMFLNRAPIGLPSKVWLGAPLIVRGRTIGAVVVQNYYSEDTFQKRDLDILDMVSQHIAFALERKEADDAIREQRQIFERIFELSPVGITLVENRIFKRVNDEFVKIFDYEKKAEVVKLDSLVDVDEIEINKVKSFHAKLLDTVYGSIRIEHAEELNFSSLESVAGSIYSPEEIEVDFGRSDLL